MSKGKVIVSTDDHLLFFDCGDCGSIPFSSPLRSRPGHAQILTSTHLLPNTWLLEKSKISKNEILLALKKKQTKHYIIILYIYKTNFYFLYIYIYFYRILFWFCRMKSKLTLFLKWTLSGVDVYLDHQHMTLDT